MELDPILCEKSPMPNSKFNSASFPSGAVKNILFDLGGVILELDRTAHESAFRHLAKAPFEDVRSRVVQSQKFKDLEMGRVGPEEFREFLRSVLVSFASPSSVDRSELQAAFSDENLDQAWKTVIRGFQERNIDLLGQLKGAGYRLALFSNINPIHFAEVKRVYERDLGKSYDTFEELFEGRAYYSHLVGMAKPDPQAFQSILNRAGFLAHETLFLDDTAEHIGGAREAGIHAKLTDIQDVLDLQRLLSR